MPSYILKLDSCDGDPNSESVSMSSLTAISCAFKIVGMCGTNIGVSSYPEYLISSGVAKTPSYQSVTDGEREILTEYCVGIAIRVAVTIAR